jgi:hypothetical protein
MVPEEIPGFQIIAYPVTEPEVLAPTLRVIAPPGLSNNIRIKFAHTRHMKNKDM